MGDLDLRESRETYTSTRVEVEDRQNFPCGKAIESTTQIVADCDVDKEERDVLGGEMRDVNEGGIKSCDALESREKTIAIIGNRWWPQTAEHDGDKICRRFLCSVWKKRNEYLNVEVSLGSRNDAPSPKGCVINGQTTKVSNKRVHLPRPSVRRVRALKGSTHLSPVHTLHFDLVDWVSAPAPGQRMTS